MSDRHSLQILNTLYEYDDFMASVSTLVDLGCGTGEDLEWWATRTTRDDVPIPLNIRCCGVDLADQLPMARKYPNITYQKTNFEQDIHPFKKSKFDVLWCYNSFQYCINPIGTLARWKTIASDGAMLIISVPHTTNFVQKQMAFEQPSGCFYHHTMVSLIHMLAVNGWDCRGGYFLKSPTDAWTHAIVYNTDIAPMDPRTTTWHQLSELKLLPESADKSVMAHNYLRQQDLTIPWIDQSLTWMGRQ
jgi:SAM-dependent methyltransferase